MAGMILIFLAMVNPLISFILAMFSLRFGKSKDWRVPIVCISLFFGNLSYCYIPESNGPDLYRYFEYFTSLKGMSLFETINNAYRGSSLYVFNFLGWIGNSMEDLHIIPAVSVFFIYYICFYVTYNYCEMEGYNRRQAFKYILYAMICMDWYSLTNNVRNVLAFVIIGYAIYRDVYQQKRDLLTICCYVVPLFIHQTSVLFIVVRLALAIFRSKKYSRLIIVFTILVNPVVDFLHENIRRITSSPLIVFVINKAYNYLFDTSSSYGLRVQRSVRSLIARILYLSLVAIICFIIYKRNNSNYDEFKDDNNYSLYVLITGLIALSCMSMLRPEYWRFAATVITFGSVAVLPIMSNSSRSTISVILVRILIPILVILCGIISWYQITWTDTSQLISDAILNVPIFNLIKGIANIIRG